MWDDNLEFRCKGKQIVNCLQIVMNAVKRTVKLKNEDPKNI